MNNLERYYDYINSGENRKVRVTVLPDLAEEYAAAGMSDADRMADRFCRLCAAQTPVITPYEQICFCRTTLNIPDILTDGEWAERREKYHIHELGYMSNVTPDYGRVLSRGLLALRDEVSEAQKREIDALLDLCERYREEAVKCGREDIAETLETVPAYPPENFRQALQMFRIIHFALWLEGTYHVTTGRFDRYMRGYFDADRDRYTRDEELELLRDFFLSFNRDSDLYPGVQQGDNGQSMVLGGMDEEGKDVWCELSELCLEASGANHFIDPKINMRVCGGTPIERYVKGSRLTAVGMGFPQYSNDDVVIPGLERLGYAHEDAVNYGVAACWEFIVPGRGCDVANISALNMPKAVDEAVRKYLPYCTDMEEFTEKVKYTLRETARSNTKGIKELYFIPAPFLSLFFDTPEGDISRGSVYNNFGMHGTGIATAADSLAAIERMVFDEKRITAEELIKALDSDFEGENLLLHALRYECPKLGQRGAKSSEYAAMLLEAFADALRDIRNTRNGIWRAGTGSAMYYLWHAAETGASPDGRRKGEAFGANYSPSLFARTDGPAAVIDEMTKPDLASVINGGPLTLEFDSAVFAEDADGSINKVSALVRYFIMKGGHQLQLNAVSREAMLDAQEHPENHRRLIVRIWGWSAYFVELDREYQNHVIARTAYRV